MGQTIQTAALEQFGATVSLLSNTVKEMVEGFRGGWLAARGMESLVRPRVSYMRV